MDIKQVFSCFKVIGFAGEPLGVAMRERFAAWGIELLTWSTAGDVALCFECLEHDGMHMWEDTGFFEVLDVESGRPVEDGGVGEQSRHRCATRSPRWPATGPRTWSGSPASHAHAAAPTCGSGRWAAWAT